MSAFIKPSWYRQSYTLTQLIEDVDNGDPVPCSDQKLIDIASAVTSELRQRLPLHAIRAGDLPETCWTVAYNRERLARYVEASVTTKRLLVS